MSIKSILSKSVFIVAVVGILVFAAVTPGVVRAFFVEGTVTDLARSVFQRQPITDAARSTVSQKTSLIASVQKMDDSSSQTDLFDHNPGTVMTGTVELIGILESNTGSAWVVSGITVNLTSTTEIYGTLNLGMTVKVEGTKQADGSILAREIKAYTDDNGGFTGIKVEFTGTLNTMAGSTWTVDTTSVIITSTTEVKGVLKVGDKVKVEGFLQPDGSVVAKEIEPYMEEPEHGEEIEFKGILNAMNGNTWTVDAITVIVSSTTKLEGTFEIGIMVKVEGYKNPDGSVLAKKIEAEDDDSEEENHGKGTEFVGEVSAINGNTWTIDGKTVIIDDKTQFEGTPEVGDKVRVAGQKQDDGTIVANNIKLVTKDNGAGGNPNDDDHGKGNGGGDDHGKGDDDKGKGNGGGGDDHGKGNGGGGDDHGKGGGGKGGDDDGDD